MNKCIFEVKQVDGKYKLVERHLTDEEWAKYKLERASRMLELVSKEPIHKRAMPITSGGKSLWK